MTQTELARRVEARLQEIMTIVAVKGDEYAPDGTLAEDDALINFKRSADIQGITPMEALRGYVSKHMVAFMDFVDREAKGIVIPRHQWKEKCGDIIIYMLLAEALVDEARPTIADGSMISDAKIAK